MEKKMLATIKNYLMLAALLLVIAGVLYIQSLRIEVTTLRLDVATYEQAAETNRKAMDLADKSCSLTKDAIRQHYEAEVRFLTSQKATGDAINALPTLTLKESNNEAPTKPQGFADDDRLSPSTMQLLDRAYCDGDKDGCTGSTK
jgi:hypothetical protein